MRIFQLRRSFAAMVLLVIGAARLEGVERKRLPILPLTTATGAPLTTERAVRAGRWLIIYTPAECAGCEALLRQIVRDEQPRVPARLVVILGGAAADQIRPTAMLFPDLGEAGWYADPGGAAVVPLQIGTAPVIFGMNGDMIEWSLGGALTGSDVKAVMSNWVADR